jgi:hypothetical protein
MRGYLLTVIIACKLRNEGKQDLSSHGLEPRGASHLLGNLGGGLALFTSCEKLVDSLKTLVAR